MDIKLKYRAWVGEKHPVISYELTNSDIETYSVEFAEWLVNNNFKSPDNISLVERIDIELPPFDDIDENGDYIGSDPKFI